MEITFWGVRGSIPTPGPSTGRWGGNTSCVEVRHPGCAPLVIDCGTGSRALGLKLIREGGRVINVLLSHLHVDHIFGFPFFAPLYGPGWQLTVWVPAYSDLEARERLGRYLNGTFHPTRLRDVPSEIEFLAMRPGRPVVVGGLEVEGVRLNHPGGAIGYRVRAPGASMAYLSDTAPFARPGEGVAAGEVPTAAEARILEFIAGVDTVVYDTMYDYDEYLEKMTWGHSYPEYAIALCRAAGVRRVVLFHHLPDADDGMLDARLARFANVTGIEVVQAAEGGTWVVSAGAAPQVDQVRSAVSS